LSRYILHDIAGVAFWSVISPHCIFHLTAYQTSARRRFLVSSIGVTIYQSSGTGRRMHTYKYRKRSCVLRQRLESEFISRIN